VIKSEIEKRKDLVFCFKESLTDFLCLVFAIIITITGFRTIYLIAILSVNGHLTWFNPFLQRINKGKPILLLKLQQIEKVMNGDEERRKELVKTKYLSLKQCVWLASVEWVLDLQVLPFVIAYLVFLPWRFIELRNIAVS
jgi:hypothetical protein